MEYSNEFDVGELREVHRALCFRSSISGELRVANSETELAQHACDIAVTTAGYHTAWVGLADLGEEKLVVPLCHSGSGADYLSKIKISWADVEMGQGPTGTSIRENRAVYCRDFSTDPKMIPWRKEGAIRGIHSAIALPLIVDHQVIGAFTLYRGQVGAFPEKEVRLLEEVAKDLAYGIAGLRVKEQKDKALIELENANQLKSQFIAIAAHELRTPIATFTFLVQMSEAQLKNGKQIDSETLNRILKQANRLCCLVEDLLNTSKLERGEMELHRSLTDLVALITGCLNNTKNLYPHRSFLFAHTEQEITLNIDPSRIEQVIVNLLDNANKYSKDDEKIEVSINRLPSAIRVSITDHGTGICKEQQAHLFTQFFRVNSDEVHQRFGLGLGLFICRNIIELHGGKISIESDLKHGSTFYFDLPT